MKALVVHAHPDPDSFSRALRDRAVLGLESAGYSCEVLDLYALDYRAVMSRDEHIAYGASSPVTDPLVAAHAAAISACDIAVFVYPTWWSSLPAILKGWIERTLVPGVAFDLDSRTNKLIPLLVNVRRVVGITTHGSPWWYVKLVNDSGRRTITRTLRASTGLRTRTTWLAMYALDGRSQARRSRFLDRVEQKMTSL